MRARGRPLPVSLAPRGAVQLACAAALLATGAVGGWFAPAAAGLALLLACASGLVEVLLARGTRAGVRGRARVLPCPVRAEDGWVRLDQHGRVIGRPGRLPEGRGLYRRRSVTLTWRDLFGFWRARRVEPSEREVRVPPAADPAMVRYAMSRATRRLLDRGPEADPTGVRPYERGDGLRQIAWRQSAHHGELMSLESASGREPPVLVVADTLRASDADALAGSAAALLRGLRRAPDVLLTDGISSWRTPVQQERFLAALAADGEREAGAARRARTCERLARGGAERRRVLLVTCDRQGPLARELSRGPLARTLVVVEARGAAPAAPAREAGAEPEGEGVAAATARTPAAPAGTSVARELAALACCCTLALLCMAPLVDMVRVGAWVAPVAALLVVGAAAGSALGSALTRQGAGALARALVALAACAALLVAGVAVASALFEARRGFGLVDATAGLERAIVTAADPLGALGALVSSGAAQLAGQPAAEGDQTWDLAIVLGGAALAAACALLASSRRTRPAVALAPLGLAAADQSVMGATDPALVATACALGLVLAWLAGPRERRVARGALAVLLACALGVAGAAGAPVDGSGELGLAGGRRVETLVDLSRDLQRNSSEVALTYATTAGGPLYLRAAVLDRFDGSTWRASGDQGALLEQPLDELGGALVTSRYVATTIETRGGSAPVPPGTVSVTSQGPRSYVATGESRLSVSPSTQGGVARGVEWLEAVVGRGVTDRLRRPEGTLEVGGDVGENVRATLERARAAGADATGGGSREQVAVVSWLVDLFTSGDFAYALDAPGGDGRDNLAVIDDFLAERRGYCTHYATAFTVLARLLGVPARVAIGYLPQDTADEDGTYEVTMRQLHAWSEVWIDGIGWVLVDVTPSADDAAATEDDGPAKDPTQPQVSATEEPGEPQEPAAPDMPQDPAADDQGDPTDVPVGEQDAAPSPEAPAWLGPVLLATGSCAAAALRVTLAARARRRRLERGDWDYAWRRACRLARRAGVRWGRDATEQDVAEAVCAALGDEDLAPEVRQIARNACLARYGGEPAGAGSPELPRTIGEIGRALRSR